MGPEMSLFSTTPEVDHLTTVTGVHGTLYACPDLAALDRHIVELCERIRHAKPRFPQLVEDCRAEIDLLLERRQWLELRGAPEAA
jgi:hypothetical protein